MADWFSGNYMNIVLLVVLEHQQVAADTQLPCYPDTAAAESLSTSLHLSKCNQSFLHSLVLERGGNWQVREL